MGLISEIISGVISPVTNLIGGIVNKKEDVSLEKYKVDGKVDINLIDAQARIVRATIDLLKNKWMIFLQFGFAAPLMIYYGKCILWDKVLGLGHTDALTGEIATYSNWIVAFLFVHSGIMALARK